MNESVKKRATKILEKADFDTTIVTSRREQMILGADFNRLYDQKCEESKERNIRAITRSEMRRAIVKRALELRLAEYPIAAIAKELDVAESTVLALLRMANAGSLVVSEVTSMNLRIRALKRAGYSNVTIAKQFGVSESTVRRRLQKPLNDAEQLTEDMREYLIDAQNELLNLLSENPIFREMFGEKVTLRVHTIHSRATLLPGERVTFKLEFSAHNKEN